MQARRPPDVLAIHPLPHPDRQVRQAGFPLGHPYVEQCWAGTIGPSCVLVLRRLPELWLEACPARVNVDELARSLGLGGVRNAGWHSRIWRTVARLTDFGLATSITDEGIGVYSQVPPLSDRKLSRLPAWSRLVHDRMLGEHLDQIAHNQDRAGAASVSSRLDHVRRDWPAPSGPAR